MQETAHDIALELFVSAKAGVGDTFSIYGRAVPTDGYWVGGKFESLVYKHVTDIDRGELAWWIGSNPASWYGVWVDETDGRIYFDGVTHMVNRWYAETLAVQRGELAIWDIANNAEIRVGELKSDV